MNVCRPCKRGQHHQCMGWCPCDELHVGAGAPRKSSSGRRSTAETSTPTATPAASAPAAACPLQTRAATTAPPAPAGDGPAPVTGAQISAATGVTLDALTQWCAAGVFGSDQVNHRPGRPRRYGPVDIVVAAACLRLSHALGGEPGGCPVAVLQQVADQVRLGHRQLHAQLDAHVTVTVDVEDLDPARPFERTPVEVGRRPCGRCQAPALGPLCGPCQLALDAGTADATREAS
jgi:hypothetical protein